MCDIHDPLGYIAPNEQEMIFTDITSDLLHNEIAKDLKVAYLGTAGEFQETLSVTGKIFGITHRAMFSILCRPSQNKENTKANINVIFYSIQDPRVLICVKRPWINYAVRSLLEQPWMSWLVLIESRISAFHQQIYTTQLSTFWEWISFWKTVFYFRLMVIVDR